jgi:hypothetical protein
MLNEPRKPRKPRGEIGRENTANGSKHAYTVTNNAKRWQTVSKTSAITHPRGA